MFEESVYIYSTSAIYLVVQSVVPADDARKIAFAWLDMSMSASVVFSLVT